MLKLNWAGQHLKALDAAMDLWMFGGEAEPPALLIEPERQGADNILNLRVVREPPAETWGCMVGDAIHNMRSALDHLAWNLVRVNKRPPSKRTAFPIFSNEPDWDRWSPNMVSGMDDGVIARIKNLQPFETGKDEPEMELLWLLSEIDNIDKHRTLHLSELFLMTADYPLPKGVKIKVAHKMARGPLQRQTQLLKFRTIPWNTPVNVEPNFTVDIALKEGLAEAQLRATPDGWPVREVIKQIGSRVTATIKGFKADFPT